MLGPTSYEIIDSANNIRNFSDFKCTKVDTVLCSVYNNRGKAAASYYFYSKRKKVKLITTDTSFLPDKYLVWDEYDLSKLSYYSNVPVYFSEECQRAYYVNDSEWSILRILESISWILYLLGITISVTIIGFVFMKFETQKSVKQI